MRLALLLTYCKRAISIRHVPILIIGVIVLWLGLWVAAKLLIVQTQLQHADAIAILSGSAVIEERALWAAQLYNKGFASRVVITNDNEQGSWSRAEQRNPFYYEQAVRVLTVAGVPREAIEVLPQPVSGTYEELLLLRRYSQEHHFNSILLVTSAYHSRRASWMGRRVFVSTGITFGLAPVPVGSQTPSPASWWLYVRGWQMIPSEYLKMIYYWLRWRNE